eukprot:3180596-Rhodomonas_salina.1
MSLSKPVDQQHEREVDWGINIEPSILCELDRDKTCRWCARTKTKGEMRPAYPLEFPGVAPKVPQSTVVCGLCRSGKVQKFSDNIQAEGAAAPAIQHETAAAEPPVQAHNEASGAHTVDPDVTEPWPAVNPGEQNPVPRTDPSSR